MAFPPWQTVYWYLMRWHDDEGTVARLHDTLRAQIRRAAAPTGHGAFRLWSCLAVLARVRLVKRACATPLHGDRGKRFVSRHFGPIRLSVTICAT
jgi:hypothetical protein